MKNCRICGSKKFMDVIDMGENPLVNSLIDKKDLDKEEQTYPLVVEQCQECSLVQITNPLDSDEIYHNIDYLYFSGDMPNLQDYFFEYADDLKERFLENGDFVLEIGSNDGTMLRAFKSHYDILGIDPAVNCVVRALDRGIPTLSTGFSERVARNIKREFGKAKLIYGNNCIAHIDDLHGVMKGVKKLLKADGVFVVECNYWGGMVENTNYSLVYHDHFSYFSLKNWEDVAIAHDMKVFDAWVTPAQGGSLRVFLSKDTLVPITHRCVELTTKESKTKLASYETCLKYEQACFVQAQELNKLINGLKAKGAKIAGYGAAAKGFSILKLARIDEKHLDYFVDDSPAKQGKYTPISHIPIVSRETAEDNLPDYFFITAPNYKDVIIKKEKELGYEGKFITDKCEIL